MVFGRKRETPLHRPVSAYPRGRSNLKTNLGLSVLYALAAYPPRESELFLTSSQRARRRTPIANLTRSLRSNGSNPKDQAPGKEKRRRGREINGCKSHGSPSSAPWLEHNGPSNWEGKGEDGEERLTGVWGLTTTQV